MKGMHERIKAIRASFKISQREFAKQIYISQSLYGEIELGNRPASERIIQLISTRFNISKDWIKNGKGDMFITDPPDLRLERLMEIFNQLDESLQDCLLEQSNSLLKIQKRKLESK